MTVTYTFDLSDDARQAAFEELRENETAAQSFENRFRQQLAAVANDAGNETGREMSITDVDIAFETEGESGPGFGLVVAALAVLGTALLAARR